MTRTLPVALSAAFLALASLPAQAENVPFFLPYPKINTSRWFISDGWSNGAHQSCEWRSKAVSVNENNIKLTLSDNPGKTRDYTCGEIHTNKIYGYGTYAVRMRAASGSGLNSSFFTYIGPPTGSPQHDEIDFEFLGKNPYSVQLNYYVNGKSQNETLIKLPYDASKEFHDYTFVWEPKKIRWYIDGKLVHETKDNVPLPSHPGRIYLALWSGSKDLNAWLGEFKYNGPASAEYAWVKFTPLP